jgi:hypothetical protein
LSNEWGIVEIKQWRRIAIWEDLFSAECELFWICMAKWRYGYGDVSTTLK